MIIDEIVAEIIDIVDDPSIETDVDLVAAVNRAVMVIASSPQIRLPELLQTGTVDTVLGVNNVPLPVDYLTGLYDCRSVTTTDKIAVLPNLGVTMRRFGLLDNTGSVEAVCVRGKTLLYQGTPAKVETLQLSYYRKPDVYTGSDDLDCLPEQFHDDIVVHFCCWKLFAKIEAGLEGRKVDTDYHRSEYYRGLDDLSRLINRGGSGTTRAATIVKGSFL